MVQYRVSDVVPGSWWLHWALFLQVTPLVKASPPSTAHAIHDHHRAVAGALDWPVRIPDPTLVEKDCTVSRQRRIRDRIWARSLESRREGTVARHGCLSARLAVSLLLMRDMYVLEAARSVSEDGDGSYQGERN
jgi:hypothetical protein